jgi:hypothetical protein
VVSSRSIRCSFTTALKCAALCCTVLRCTVQYESADIRDALCFVLCDTVSSARLAMSSTVRKAAL